MDSATERLLKAVWGDRKGFVFLPHKDASNEKYPKGGWHETKGFDYRGELPDLQQLPVHADLYFCPVVFSENRRLKENALPTNVLWADLDPVHPDQCKIKPSVAWESSPGRYQALWFLDEEVEPSKAAELSKRIAYGDGGDKGGWDLTQVLRIPGTVNHKYPSKPPVRLLWATRRPYPVSRIEKSYPRVNGAPSLQSSVSMSWIEIPESVIGTAVASLPIGTRRRLFASTEGADRSLELQKLARDLLRSGIDSQIVLHLLQRSTWNKFAGRLDEHSQLLKQVESAQAAVINYRQKRLERSQSGVLENGRPSELPHGIALVSEMQTWKWNEFLSIPTSLKWLIEDSWVDQTVGFISGRAKSYKTWIALDFALSILSGAPFLGKFPVARTGPVLLIQEEDPAAILQERLRLIAKAKGMLPTVKTYGATSLEIDFPEYPLTLINLQGFSLTATEKIAQVRRLLGDTNPVLVILDPLIVMLGHTDENRAVEVAGLLQEVKMWREDFKCNVLIVHHWNKAATQDGDRGGAHMYGSFAFHAWLESALHMEPIVDPESSKIDTVVMEREFKAAIGSRQLKLRFAIDSLKDYTYEVIHEGETLGVLAIKLIDLLNERQNWMTTGELVDSSGYSRSKVIEELHKLRRLGKLDIEVGGGRGRSSKYKIKEEKG